MCEVVGVVTPEPSNPTSSSASNHRSNGISPSPGTGPSWLERERTSTVPTRPSPVEEDWLNTYDADQLGTSAEGGTFTVGPFTVHVERANDPDADHPVTYVVDHDAGTFFHGEDSKPVDAFADVGDRYGIDLGVLAYGTGG